MLQAASLRRIPEVRIVNYPFYFLPQLLSISITSIPYQLHHQKTSHRPLYLFYQKHLFPQKFRKLVSANQVFCTYVFVRNFLGCILLLESAGSRDITLYVNTQFQFTVLVKVHQCSGQSLIIAKSVHYLRKNGVIVLV